MAGVRIRLDFGARLDYGLAHCLQAAQFDQENPGR